MEFAPLEISDLKIGQPLPWDLFDQEQKPLFERGYIIRTSDELKEISQSPIFRRREEPSEKTQKTAEKQTNADKQPKYVFNDMKLKVGDKLQINASRGTDQLSNKTNNDFHLVKLIGYLQDQTLIVTMPRTDYSLLDGDQVMVRFFCGKCAFSFTVFVDKIIKQPFKYLHLSFPKLIQGQTIRKSRRIKCNFPAKIENNPAPLVITNLSGTGAEINTTSNLGKPGTAIALSFTVNVHDQETALQIPSMIKTSKQTDQDVLSFGIEFTELKPDQLIILHSLINQVLAENPHKIV
jgi:flagellar protein YcgR/PilZ domain-containing protein